MWSARWQMGYLARSAIIYADFLPAVVACARVARKNSKHKHKQVKQARRAPTLFNNSKTRMSDYTREKAMLMV